MRTICLNQGPFQLSESVATIGVFDGVHAGHQLLIRMVREEARSRGLCPMVITFDRQPRQVLDPTFHPQVLTTLEEKEAIIASLGVETLVVLPFTKELAALTARDFMQQVLRQQLQVQTLITGYDNRFGRNRAEGFDDYVRYGRQMGIEVVRGDVAKMGGDVAVSSTAIRRMLAEDGAVERMPDCLTRLYAISGTIVPGEHIGHELGFPTANLCPENTFKLIPASGVYAVWVSIDGSAERLPAMMNIGTRPTFEGTDKTLEAHILSDVGDIYGHRLTVSFVARLREERRFESSELLVRQLQHDRDCTLRILMK
jgi:riboflavin kinase/FMN adenylyltransferase